MMQTTAIAPYNFVRTRRKYIPVGLQTSSVKFAQGQQTALFKFVPDEFVCFSSLKNTVPVKVYCALTLAQISADADVIFSATVGGHGWPESSPTDGLWRVAEKTSRSNRDFEEMQSQVALKDSEKI